jgi:hypothetical protein
MKNLAIILSIAVMAFSCKKDKTPSDFKATDVTGTTIVKGNANKTVVTPNGTGGWTNTHRIPASGVLVSITVNRNSLYPNSNSQGADVYTATTDSAGNYRIEVKANATGVNARITIEGFTGTHDTLVNGTTKKGLYSTFAGTNLNVNLVMGQNFTQNFAFNASNAVSNPGNANLNAGTGVITGSIGIQRVQAVAVGTNPPVYNPVIVPFPAGHKVYMSFDKDPTTGNTRLYQTTTDGNGYYKFTVNTVPSGTSGFNQEATIWIEDYASTRDTILLNNTVKTGPKGVYQMESRNQSDVYNNSIKNANHLAYDNFIND